MGEPKVRVTLYQGLPKGQKLELVIQKCVELGIARIVPVITDRVVVKLDSGDAERKALRWRKIAEEAAKQSGRGIIPEITVPIDFRRACDESQDSVKVILWEMERENSLRRVLEGRGKSQRISVLIGPEGGLSVKETEYAMGRGWERVTIGPRILRTETAGLAVLSAIMYAMEEMEWETRP